MTSAIGNTSPLTSGGGSPTRTANPLTDPLASENTFLKLLVTQLKNQDPTSPQDGTQFVAQLAQFSGVEQQLQMRQDLDAIKQILSSTLPAATAASDKS